MHTYFKTIITKYRAYIICISLLFAASIIAFVPSYQKSDDKTQQHVSSDEVDLRSCGYSTNEGSSCPEQQGIAFYVDGNLVAVALSSDDIETALSNYVNEQATFSYGEYTQAEIVNKTEYIKGSYSTDIFTKDIDAAIKNTAFSLKVTVMSLTDLKVAPKTIYVDNSDLLEGKEKTLSEGKDGVREDTYAQTFINGELKDELLLKSIYKIEPQNKIIERGVMLSPKKETASVAIFVAPYDGGISSAYGTRYLLGSNFHGGVDFAAKASGQNCFKAPVVAAGDGIVVGASYSGNFGKLIIIEHSNGIRTYYAHLNDFAVKVGQKVNQGEMIAHIGLTGQTQGPHVHFEVRLPDGKGDYYRVNPKYYIIDYESYLR